MPRGPQQWWVLTARMITPTLRNGEFITQVAGSIVFTIGFYLPLKNIMGHAQPMSSYAQYLTPLIVVQAVWFAAVPGPVVAPAALEVMVGVRLMLSMTMA